MNIERFHNELTMRLGYERIVKDKRILISVEESDDLEMVSVPEMQNEIRTIIVAAHQAYLKSANDTFACFC